jgi:hypothetical protein
MVNDTLRVSPSLEKDLDPSRRETIIPRAATVARALSDPVDGSQIEQP